MRLLFVGTSKTGGGTETHFVTLSRALARAGHDVAAVVHPGAPIWQALQDSDVRLYDGVFRNSLDIRGIRAVGRAARSFRPDWIVGSFSKEYWPLIYISKRTGIRLALFRHMATRMKRGTQYFIPRLADRFIVISEYMKKLFAKRGVPEKRLQVLYNPLDIDHYRPDPESRARSRRELGIDEAQLLVGYIGALHPGKGIFTLLSALETVMQRAPEVHALWIGRGIAEAALREKLANTRDPQRHILKGYIDNVRPWLAAMDVLVLPSQEPDTFGRVLIEAQAMGVPVIGSDIGGLPEAFLPEQTGKLIAPGDAGDCADKLLLFRDPALRQQLGEQGRQYVHRKFDAGQIAGAFAALLASNDTIKLTSK